jgi:hypothetical protein
MVFLGARKGKKELCRERHFSILLYPLDVGATAHLEFIFYGENERGESRRRAT